MEIINFNEHRLRRIDDKFRKLQEELDELNIKIDEAFFIYQDFELFEVLSNQKRKLIQQLEVLESEIYLIENYPDGDPSRF